MRRGQTMLKEKSNKKKTSTDHAQRFAMENNEPRPTGEKKKKIKPSPKKEKATKNHADSKCREILLNLWSFA